MKEKFILMLAGISLLAVSAAAQVRPIESDKSSEPKKIAPASFAAKYEGGMFGFDEKEEGTLKFDDVNNRIIFFGKDQKEKFSIAYDTMQVIYPQSKSVTSTTGQVVRNIPLPGAALGGFIKEKRRYLVLHFDDPDVDIKGVANFKLETKELLDAVVETLGEKAKLTRRGEAFYRPRAKATQI